ncbi:MAG: hypothetical protein CL742_08290 [Chloroflexi bacterium]|nr:hypothetical protein [Chloroflexota bacterium]
MSKTSEHIFTMHIEDGAPSHPGGSNNYFVGDPQKKMVIIDTGDYERNWTKSIIDYYIQLGKPSIEAILITHGHGDHTGGLDRIQDLVGCPVRCHPDLAGKLSRILGDESMVVPLEDREKIHLDNSVDLEVIFTPGHEVDHVCYYLASDRAMFTGDAVLGASSTSVRDLTSYMKSLELITAYEHDTVCPAHGPVVPPPKGKGLVRWQLDHRISREKQVLESLENGEMSISDIRSLIYPSDLDERLIPTAESNVERHLDKLVGESMVRRKDSVFTIIQ